jgi:hypothetical protein
VFDFPWERKDSRPAGQGSWSSEGGQFEAGTGIEPVIPQPAPLVRPGVAFRTIELSLQKFVIHTCRPAFGRPVGRYFKSGRVSAPARSVSWRNDGAVSTVSTSRIDRLVRDPFIFGPVWNQSSAQNIQGALLEPTDLEARKAADPSELKLIQHVLIDTLKRARLGC